MSVMINLSCHWYDFLVINTYLINNKYPKKKRFNFFVCTPNKTFIPTLHSVGTK